MSGPKSSSYTLSDAQRAILLEQQRREQELALERQRVQAEQEKQERLQEEIRTALSVIERHIERINRLRKESGHSGGEADALLAARGAAKSRLDVLLKTSPSGFAEWKRRTTEMQSVHIKLASVLTSASELSGALGASYRKELANTIDSGLSLSFSKLRKTGARSERCLNHINELLASVGEEIPAPLRARFQNIRQQADAIQNTDYLKNFLAVVVEPFVRTCRECRDYDEAAERYRLLADEAHVQPQSFDCSVDGLSAMEEASARLEAAILEDRERSYINAALDAALQEMGYELVGNRTQVKKNGRRIRHELYSLKNGTAVDVTYTDNGQISMELAGIATADRSPSREESEQLVEDMRSFCEDYAKFERKLAERGVLTEKISHLPPSADYAQILNIQDYTLSRPVESFEAGRRRAVGQAVMRMDEP